MTVCRHTNDPHIIVTTIWKQSHDGKSRVVASRWHHKILWPFKKNLGKSKPEVQQQWILMLWISLWKAQSSTAKKGSNEYNGPAKVIFEGQPCLNQYKKQDEAMHLFLTWTDKERPTTFYCQSYCGIRQAATAVQPHDYLPSFLTKQRCNFLVFLHIDTLKKHLLKIQKAWINVQLAPALQQILSSHLWHSIAYSRP